MGDHCAWLAEDGSVWTSGSNNYGQLGLGDKIDRKCPSRVPNLPPISSVQCGFYTTICLDSSSNLWSFGFNANGQLGLGDTAHRSSPQKVPGIPPVLSFNINNHHSILICGGSIWVFGHNEYGQLGVGPQTYQSTPVQIPSSSSFPSEIISVACGYFHSLFLTCQGQVLSCGYNGDGQLGQSDFTNRTTPSLISNMAECIQITCGGHVSCMVDSSHHLWVCGAHYGSQTTPLCFPSVGLIQSISIGYQHTLFVTQKGELWGWGRPYYGQLGNGSVEPWASPILLKQNIKACLCIGHSSYIRNISEEDFCCGKNSSGQLGVNHTRNQLSFFKIPERRTKLPIEEGEEEEQFRMWFPAPIRKFSQKSARSALPLSG